MELGLVGLGKMGGNMRERIRRAGHTVIGYDRNPDVADVHSLEELVGKLKGPRVVWVMVPAGAATQSTIDELADLLSPGDVVVDGGNSRWTDDEKHAVELGIKDIGFVDCGVSGGVWGLEKVDSVTDVREVFRSWQEGTVIRSWLLDLAVNALDDDEHLDQLRGFAADSGEGRWTVEAAIDNAVPLPAITAALFARFVSRQDDSPAMKAVAAMRNQF